MTKMRRKPIKCIPLAVSFFLLSVVVPFIDTIENRSSFNHYRLGDIRLVCNQFMSFFYSKYLSTIEFQIPIFFTVLGLLWQRKKIFNIRTWTVLAIMLVATQLNYVLVWQFMTGSHPVGRRIASTVYLFMSPFIAFGITYLIYIMRARTHIKIVVGKRTIKIYMWNMKISRLLAVTICFFITVNSLFAYTSGPGRVDTVYSEDAEALNYIVNDAKRNYCLVADRTRHAVHQALADHSVYYRANTQNERVVLRDLEISSYYQIVRGAVDIIDQRARVIDMLDHVMNKTGTSLCYLLVQDTPLGLTNILNYTRMGRWYIFKYAGVIYTDLPDLATIDLYSDNFSTAKYLSDVEIIENISHFQLPKPFLAPSGKNTKGEIVYSFSVTNDTETFVAIRIDGMGLSFQQGNPLILSLSVDNGFSWEEVHRLDDAGGNYVWFSFSYPCNTSSFKLRFELIEDDEIRASGGYPDVRLVKFSIKATILHART